MSRESARDLMSQGLMIRHVTFPNDISFMMNYKKEVRSELNIDYTNLFNTRDRFKDGWYIVKGKFNFNN